MKRDAQNLEKERVDELADQRLRVELARAAELEERSRRVAASNSTSASKIEGNLKKWNNSGVYTASRVDLIDPKPSPIGMKSLSFLRPFPPLP